MKSLFQNLHSRLGDFWWYSLLIFLAARAADVLNAFVGLWIVPKYVDPKELGALMPLANYANFLAMPVAVFANTFRNEVSRLAVANEFGRLKTLMRGVFIAAGVFLFLAIVVSRFLLPAFLARIRIVEGSLGFLIIVASFVGAVHPIFNNALQALKKFNSCALIGVVSAPIRLVAMLVAMPFRAVSGYFVGQMSTPAFQILASVFCLRKELSVPAEPYWNRAVVRSFTKLLTIFAAMALSGGLCGLVESTVLRQRLPDLDSAGYYMATRFSEVANYLMLTLCFTIFPFAAELSAKGKSASRLILKATLASFAFSALVSLPFFFFGAPILSLLPHGDQYAAYWWAIPWLIGIGCLTAFTSLFTTAEIAANRFGYLKWMIPLDLAYPALLLVVTVWGYFAAYAPEPVNAFFESHNIHTLSTMLWWMTSVNLIKVTLCLVALLRKK